jgi:uncharacterized paraquat-inducible protein A
MRLPDSFLLWVFVCSLYAAFLGGCSREPSTSDVVKTLLPFILIIVITMYYVFIRSEQKNAKDRLWAFENRKFVGASVLLVSAVMFYIVFFHPEHFGYSGSSKIAVGIERLLAFFTSIIGIFAGLWLLLGQQPPTERTATNKKSFCNQCGEQLIEGDRFCGKCGAQVS